MVPFGRQAIYTLARNMLYRCESALRYNTESETYITQGMLIAKYTCQQMFKVILILHDPYLQ